MLKNQNGKKVYSDGEQVEKRMLEIAKKYPGDLSQDYIANDSTYVLNYTFSSVRENILNWYPFNKEATLLEIGAGMGSITGMLCDRVSHVTSIEMSEARAEVIRARNSGRDNLTVLSEDINEWDSEETFDYIVFIGVLEYADLFSDKEFPFEFFLKNVKKHLKKDGVILFAIENRFGLKYWMGAAEDHLWEPFVGVNGYIGRENGPRTFSKAELKEILEAVGLNYCRFYSVLPDYKFPKMLIADDYSVDGAELKQAAYTYFRGSMLWGDERELYKDLTDNGVFPFFANSFLIETSPELLEDYHICHVSAKGEMYREFRVSTVIDSKGKAYKLPMHEDAKLHVTRIKENYEYLKNRGIRMLPLKEDGDGRIYTDIYEGEIAQRVFRKALLRNDRGKLGELISLLREALLQSSDHSRYTLNNIIVKNHLGREDVDYGIILQKAFVDMTFFNAFLKDGKLVFFDQEWCFEHMPLNFCIYYAIKKACQGANVRSGITIEEMLEMAGIAEQEIDAYEETENYIWSNVFYRQTDFYGEDELCTGFKKEITQCYQEEKTREQTALLQNEKESLLNEKESLQNENSSLYGEKVSLQSEVCLLQDENERIKKGLEIETINKQEQAVELTNAKGHINQLLESERRLKNEINEIRHSRLFRVMSQIWNVEGALIPVGSKRRRSIGLALRSLRHPGHIKEYVEEYRSWCKWGSDGLPQDLSIEKVETNSAHYKPIKLPHFEHPMVSIIIPVFNQFAFTYQCIKSIVKNTKGVSYEIIIADDCSDDETTEAKKYFNNIRTVRTTHNVRFLLNVNNASKHAKGKYILFLNNDTQPQRNWLKPMVDLMESSDDVGIVGSKLLYPDGTLQEAGGVWFQNGNAWNYGNGQNPNMPEYNYVKEADYVSGASLMIRTDLWKEIGGFDERYVPAYCEDADLAFEVRKKGFKVLYQPKSAVVHFEGKSNGTDIHSGIKQYQIQNMKKLREKWSDAFQELAADEDEVFLGRDRSVNKKTILFIDHYVPHIDKDAGSKSTFSYVKMLVEKGYNVKFLGDNFYKHEPYTDILEQMGVEVLYGNWYVEHFWEWMDKNHGFIDIVFAQRPHITIKYIDRLRAYGDMKILYYGHDLHFLRMQREYQLTKDESMLQQIEEQKETELYIMKRSDVVYYPSCVETEMIRTMDSDIEAKTLPLYVYDQIPDRTIDNFDVRKGILFVGGFGHPPNADAVKWFIKEIYPIVRKTQDIPFYVIGANPPEEIKELDGNGAHILGFVTEEELQNKYSECRLVVIPLRYGAGVKGKMLEALYYGCPVITTSVGAEGVEDIETVVEIADDEKIFAEKILSMYDDTELLSRKASGTVDFIRRQFSEEAVWDKVKEDFS